MSFVGKVLIVAQVLMSIAFMAFAGAVFAVHENWKTKAESLQTALDDRDRELQDWRADYERKETALTQEREAADNAARQAIAENQQLQEQLVNAQAQNNRLDEERRVAQGLAQAKAEEAAFRQEEATAQRIANKTLQETLATAIADLQQKEDTLFSAELVNEELRDRHDSLLGETGDLKRILRVHGLPTDPSKIASEDEPAPPVDGVIVATRKDKTNRTEFVEVSIGSDDGLLKNHVLDVFRSSAISGDSKYLGKIKIIYVTNDRAVGEVVQAAKNGIIERGDNVTTRL